ncbi:hypothetical protein B9Z19DRAFT_1062916 [Tuber borchii]|uniref:Uncharacterized protein n=1 Tax=Tuber borchii TaxID=42251 RepID=A0A2T7A043_TUBBO|nr:hypothetical protein B9Z19DRAFT_1062916 [Tuber borchii]
MSSSRIRFLPPLTESSIREFLCPGTSAPMNEELPAAPPPPPLIPESRPNIPSSREIGLQCNHLATKILTSSDPASRSRWVWQLITLTSTLSSKLNAFKNNLNIEAARTAEAQAINDQLRRNLAVAEEALATTVSMLTAQTAIAASARASLRKKTAEVNARDLEIERMKEALKQSIDTNHDSNRKTATKLASCVCGETSNGNDARMGVPPRSGERVENPIGQGPRSIPDSERAEIAILERALIEKTRLLKAEEQRTAGLRKLLNSAVEEFGLLKTCPAAVTEPTRPPLPEIPRYDLGAPRTPTKRERRRLKHLRLANNHRQSKKAAPRQRAEWIFGEKAERALSTTAGETEAKGPFVRGINEGDNISSLDSEDPFVGGGQGKRYMTFPPEVAPKCYRPGAGQRRGNAMYAV